MMLAARRASLVLVVVLASVSTVAAECAWVLWERTGGGEPGSADTVKLVTEPVRAYDRRVDCQRKIAAQLARFREPALGQTARVSDDLQEAIVTTRAVDGKTVTKLFGYTCLPDTIDPRGPKAK
jgi:hypothetical protein